MHKYLFAMTMLLTVGFATQVVSFGDSWGENPQFNIISETRSGMEVVFSLHELLIEDVDIDGVPMKSYGLASIYIPQVGAPSLGGATRYVAVPQGAQVQLTLVGARTEVYQGVEIAPAPNIPRENDDSPLRYEKDMKVYGRNAYYPEAPVLVSAPMQIRGVDVVIVNVTPFQYNPVTKELVVYRDLRFRLDYVGGNGHFGDDRLRSRFWEPLLQGQLLNYGSLSPVDFYAAERMGHRDGWEYVIIVPDDPVFIAWADTIKAWRKLQGISCEVFTTTEVGGNTTTAIETFLNNAYNTWDPAPAAFLLLSDYQSSGDLYGITSPVWNSYCVSDNIYADVNGDDLPDMHYARICAQNDAQLSIMINKFLDYERSPYTAPDFYNEPLVSGGWNSNSWLQINLEAIRGFWEFGLGKDPAHEYKIISGSVYAGYPWSSGPSAQSLVLYFYNLGWLADTLNPYDSTYWNSGSASGINTAINSGAFFVQHQATGSETGWLWPQYSISDLYGLTNNMFPFVNSTDALTGNFAWGSECFAERFHRIGNGALGLNAATEIGYAFVTDAYLWGLIDGIWPDFLPDYPGNGQRLTGSDILRPCMAMTSAKYYLQQSSWPSNPQQKIVTYNLFHHHGDAFTTLYSEMPQYLTVIHDTVLPAGQNTFAVTADDSAVIALTVDGEIIGVAEGTDSPVIINIQPQPAGATMKVTVTKANYYRYDEDVPVMQIGVSEGDNVRLPPAVLSVSQVTPNPFIHGVSICYGIPEAVRTTVSIYDISGRLVEVLHDGTQQPGWHSVTWNGGDHKNTIYPSGVYLCELKTEDSKIVEKLILLK